MGIHAHLSSTLSSVFFKHHDGDHCFSFPSVLCFSLSWVPRVGIIFPPSDPLYLFLSPLLWKSLLVVCHYHFTIVINRFSSLSLFVSPMYIPSLTFHPPHEIPYLTSSSPTQYLPRQYHSVLCRCLDLIAELSITSFFSIFLITSPHLTAFVAVCNHTVMLADD